MLDKIFKMFFSEKKQSKKTAIITVVRQSSLFNENEIINIKRSKELCDDLTCLSEYFRGIKGLNLKERQLAKQTSK